MSFVDERFERGEEAMRISGDPRKNGVYVEMLIPNAVFEACKSFEECEAQANCRVEVLREAFPKFIRSNFSPDGD